MRSRPMEASEYSHRLLRKIGDGPVDHTRPVRRSPSRHHSDLLLHIRRHRSSTPESLVSSERRISNDTQESNQSSAGGANKPRKTPLAIASLLADEDKLSVPGERLPADRNRSGSSRTRDSLSPVRIIVSGTSPYHTRQPSVQPPLLSAPPYASSSTGRILYDRSHEPPPGHADRGGRSERWDETIDPSLRSGDGKASSLPTWTRSRHVPTSDFVERGAVRSEPLVNEQHYRAPTFYPHMGGEHHVPRSAADMPIPLERMRSDTRPRDLASPRSTRFHQAPLPPEMHTRPESPRHFAEPMAKRASPPRRGEYHHPVPTIPGMASTKLLSFHTNPDDLKREPFRGGAVDWNPSRIPSSDAPAGYGYNPSQSVSRRTSASTCDPRRWESSPRSMMDYRNCMLAGTERFASVSEQSAYMAGFEDGWNAIVQSRTHDHDRKFLICFGVLFHKSIEVESFSRPSLGRCRCCNSFSFATSPS